MKPSSTPIRIDTDLYSAATNVAPLMSRSTTQQISHWARIGRELELSTGISIEEISQVLRGAKAYDSLNTEEQAIVRASWAEKVAAWVGALRLDQKFEAEGRPYVEFDENGAVSLQTRSPAGGENLRIS